MKNIFKKGAAFALAFAGLMAVESHGQLIITQFYEGSSNNKWLELTNVGSSTIDFSTTSYNLSLWQNANTEAYKTGAGAPSQNLAIDTGTLTAGSSLLYSHASAVLPSYATANVQNSSVINFNGDDSLVLTTGSTYDFANIVDAIGFTDLGNEGADVSFVRIDTAAGYNFTTGSTVLDFATVWSQFSNAAVDSALVGSEERLGFSSVPEPSSALLLLLGGLSLAILRRRK